MTSIKDRMLRLIYDDAARQSAHAATQLISAPPEAKELILAELDFEQWLAELVSECLLR